MISKWFLNNRKSSALLTFMVGIGLSSLALATDDPEIPKPWPERILRVVHTRAEHAFAELTSALFNSLDSIDAPFLRIPGNGKVGVQVHRTVLDNFDEPSTYTVVDRAQLKVNAHPLAGVTTWAEDVQTTGIGTPYIGMIFEPQAMIEWTNFRQVKAFDLSAEKTAKQVQHAIEDRQKEIVAESSPSTVASPLPEPSPDPDLSELNPDLPRSFLDPAIRARFSKVLNLATFPFRLPLHRADVSRMQNGEILAYAFDGQIEIGASTGLKIIPALNVLSAGLNIFGTVVLHGRYQISVLREDARYARVKLTQLSERGSRAGIKLSIERKRAFSGVSDKHFLKQDFKIVPFDLESSKVHAGQFDVLYRYDLNDPGGKKAYHKAVLGRFVESETITGGVTGDATKPVQKLLSRESKRITGDVSGKIGLSALLKVDWDRKKDSLVATLELPDGTHNVLEAFREKKHGNRAVFGATSESRSRRMTLYLDAELLAKKDPTSVFVITEMTEEDSDTNADELNRYIGRMEKLLRKPGILPEMARHREAKQGFFKDLFKGRRAWYGRSSFYYGYSLSLDEVTAFLHADRGKVEDAARKYFNLDQAERFIAAWVSAAAALDSGAPAQNLYSALRGIFAAKFSIEPLTNVIFDSIPTQTIDYFVTAQNAGFGHIQERGKTMTSVEKALTNTDRELGDTYAKRLKQDPDAIVSQISIEKLPSGLRKLRFRLAKPASNVVFRLRRITGTNGQRPITETPVNNWKDRFVVGENSIVLDPKSTDELTARLSRHLRIGSLYRISVGYSQKDDLYGPMATATDFSVDEPYPKAE